MLPLNWMNVGSLGFIFIAPSFNQFIPMGVYCLGVAARIPFQLSQSKKGHANEHGRIALARNYKNDWSRLMANLTMRAEPGWALVEITMVRPLCVGKPFLQY